ncbi:hypothetical protein J8F10_10175 [Gemmata sp. G18]|uniref:DUF2270 domain-containing protein n=1 Tax=Gemmata palustris TaxID=2822762 RepID=A0ABS5BPQ5_9BACT|nr:hypothetical protein [Gemmata palustris]MBP3955646.1 hypothetical protein [Gemmata palustris]
MATDDENAKALPEGYTYLRQELRFEHTLLGSRMTYYMTSQSFLFTTAAIARAVQWHGVYWFSGVMVPIVGIAASAVLLFSIHAAYGRMDQWRAKEKLFEGKHPLIVLYPEEKHRKSLLFTTLMPWLLISVWIVFAVLIHIFKPQGGGM